MIRPKKSLSQISCRILQRTLLTASVLILVAAVGCNKSENRQPEDSPPPLALPLDTVKESKSPSTQVKAPVNYVAKRVKSLKHDVTSYTQGMEIYGGKLYVSDGQYNESRIRIVNPSTGQVIKSISMEPNVFAEGLTVFNEKVYQLTWENRIGFVYDLQLNRIGTFPYSGEGWGITHDSQFLILSDGTNQLRYLHPSTFEVVKLISVTDRGIAVDRINELEMVDGIIYANIWQTKEIVMIDPTTGHVTGRIDCRAIVPTNSNHDVLNGIAFNPKSKKLLITGKWWDSMFEIQLVKALSK